MLNSTSEIYVQKAVKSSNGREKSHSTIIDLFPGLLWALNIIYVYFASIDVNIEQ